MQATPPATSTAQRAVAGSRDVREKTLDKQARETIAVSAGGGVVVGGEKARPVHRDQITADGIL